ncbi:MAG: 4-hydroxythreonine-4-phosphate dehydrogenase PdxA [Chloroflexi bacterium HGW-Chloroflexi-10]|nr:MAG: 4-hydroxythreonine-4-phosphate dehydrogenase PdxA [Chloroflexi bacterium HGW-Chloroflexi-10]
MKDAQSLPILAITMGDPAGCGPEIIAKVLTSDDIYTNSLPLVIGSTQVLKWALDTIGKSAMLHVIQEPAEAQFAPGIINVIDLNLFEITDLKFGEIQELGGKAAYEYLIYAIDLAMAGAVDAIVTAPLSKEAMNLAGFHFDGHTEILAKRTGTEKVSMMLASKNFHVTHVSTHCSLRTAIDRCKTARILDVIHLTHEALQQMNIATPRIAIAGLNPHCGENGLFGSEDVEQIQPAIDLARAEGISVYEAPVPPDTVFVRMAQSHEFDAVVAQYHDQGHIASKIVDFWGGVNITLGLPIIRTSVDHGTAFDIVGTGKANPESLFNAITYARVMANNRLKQI